MEKMKNAWVSPVLSANLAQGGRVVGKPAKERPKQNKRHFREFLHPSGAKGRKRKGKNGWIPSHDSRPNRK